MEHVRSFFIALLCTILPVAANNKVDHIDRAFSCLPQITLSKITKKLCSIQSSIDNLDLEVDLSTLTDKVCTIDSKIDEIMFGDVTLVCDVDLSTITDKICTIDSKIDEIMTGDVTLVCDVDLSTLTDKVCTIDSKIDEIMTGDVTLVCDVDLTTITDKVCTIDSKLDALMFGDVTLICDVDLTTITDKVCSIDSKIDALMFGDVTLICDVDLTTITDKVCSIDSKLDALMFGDTTLICDVDLSTLTDKVCTIDSKIDNLEDLVKDIIIGDVTITVVCDVDLNTVTDKVCTVDSKIDNLASNDISILDKVCEINSKIDNLSLQGTVVCDVDLSTLTDKVCTIDSKIDNLILGEITVVVDVDPCDPTAITAPTTISIAGSYCLANDIDAGVSTALLISTSNVVVDLNGHVVSGGTGVDVEQDLDSIIVKNGSIKCCTSGMLVARGCSRIVVDFVGFVDIEGVALSVNGTSASDIIDVTITNCCMLRCAGTPLKTRGALDTKVLELDNCTNIWIDNVQIIECGCDTPENLDGIILSDCAEACISNVSINSNCGGNSPINPDDPQVAFRGISGCNLINSRFENCTVVDNEGLGEVRGFSLEGTSEHNTFNNCFANENESTNNVCYGFRISDGSEKNLFTNCKTQNNTSALRTFGFASFAEGSIFIECIATGNNNSITPSSRGFLFSAGTVTNDIRCTAIRCIATENDFGFVLSQALDCELKECQALHNRIVGFFGDSSSEDNSASNLFIKNIAFNNDTTNYSKVPSLVSATTSTLDSVSTTFGNLDIT